jgi:hypothetical protein
MAPWLPLAQLLHPCMSRTGHQPSKDPMPRLYDGTLLRAAADLVLRELFSFSPVYTVRICNWSWRHNMYSSYAQAPWHRC